MDEITLRFDQSIASRVINDEIAGIYGQELLSELQSLIRFYHIYDSGADFPTEGAKDYTPATMKYKKARTLINKEARFLFGKPPDFFVSVPPASDSEQAKKKAKQDASVLLRLITDVLKTNKFNKKLIQAAKDAFIGRRVAAIVNFEEQNGIIVNFIPSLEFVAEMDQNNNDRLTKLICFYTVKDSKSRSNQEIYRKKYWMQDGFCWVVEEIRNGMDEVIETLTPEKRTGFPFIPAVVIINDGLSGDVQGESEIEQLEEAESWYSKLANADIDAERKGMNPIRYTVDMSSESTRNLPVAPGSFWDLQSTQNFAEGSANGKVGILEPSMKHSDPLSVTLDRINNDMHEQLSVPDVSPAAMKGIVSSGKTLKAIYWDLIVRCDEKMQTWRPALEFIARCIVEGARLYPNIAKRHLSGPIPNVDYSITVDNQYPLPEDETEEKQTDLQEVSSRARSVKSYLKKWQNLSDDEADAELQQIVREQRLFEDSFTGDLGGEM